MKSLDRQMSNLQLNEPDNVVAIHTATSNAEFTKEDIDDVRDDFKIRNCNCYNTV